MIRWWRFEGKPEDPNSTFLDNQAFPKIDDVLPTSQTRFPHTYREYPKIAIFTSNAKSCIKVNIQFLTILKQYLN